MSKRLEEIIKLLEDKAVIDRNDFEWLIEQAERVQELEQQNKRYREVIKEALVYADSPKILTNPAGIEKILAKALEGEE